MSRDLARALRWRHASFRRRRLPFVVEVVTQPLRNAWYLATHPQVLRVVIAVRRAVAQGQHVMAA